jgi:MFS family permease
MKSTLEAAVIEAGTPQRTRLPLSAFFLGSVISYVGDTLTLLAIPWFVLQTTGSVTQTGITAFFSVVPMVLSAFFGSALVDRWGYKRTSVIGDLASGLTVVLIPLPARRCSSVSWSPRPRRSCKRERRGVAIWPRCGRASGFWSAMPCC